MHPARRARPSRLACLLFPLALACSADAGSKSGGKQPDEAAVEAAVAACPKPTDGCMNEDNAAQCRDKARQCPGEVVTLESCPLQFRCP